MRMQQYVMMRRALQATDLFHMFVEETPWTVRVVHPVYVMERHRSSGWAVGAGNKRTEHIPCPCSMCNSVQPLSWCLQEAQHTVWTLYVVILQAAYQRKRCSNMSLMAFWRDSSIWSTAFQATGRCITATSSSKQSWKAGRIRSRRLVDWSWWWWCLYLCWLWPLLWLWHACCCAESLQPRCFTIANTNRN